MGGAMTHWTPYNPMPEGTVYFDGSGEMFDSSKWERPFFDDDTYLQIVGGMPLPCTDIIWVNPERRCMYLAWRVVHSTKGPWMFGGRQRRGEAPRAAAVRLLQAEIGTDINPDDLHFVQWAIAFSKYRQQEPQNAGAHYVLFHYCYVATPAVVAHAAENLAPEEYDCEHGIRPYSRADLEAIDPHGPYGFNRAILLEEFGRLFGPEQ